MLVSLHVMTSAEDKFIVGLIHFRTSDFKGTEANETNMLFCSIEQWLLLIGKTRSRCGGVQRV